MAEQAIKEIVKGGEGKQKGLRHGVSAMHDRFVFYGTLRENQGNFNHFVKPIKGKTSEGTHILEGYKMFSFGGYPAVYKTNNSNDKILVEAWHVPDELACRSIHMMEIGAGYDVEEVEIGGKMYWLYTHDEKWSKGKKEVENGDWVAWRTAQVKAEAVWR